MTFVNMIVNAVNLQLRQVIMLPLGNPEHLLPFHAVLGDNIATALGPKPQKEWIAPPPPFKSWYNILLCGSWANS